MRKIRLNESQFNKLVSKCVKKALNETMRGKGDYEGSDLNYIRLKEDAYWYLLDNHNGFKWQNVAKGLGFRLETLNDVDIEKLKDAIEDAYVDVCEELGLTESIRKSKKSLRESMMDEYEWDNGDYEGYSPMPHYSDAERKKMQMDDDWNELKQNPPYKPTTTQWQKDFDYSENGNRNLNDTQGKYAMDALKYPNGYQGKGFGGLFYGNGIYKRSSLADEKKSRRK